MSNGQAKPSKLRRLAEQWVRAEYLFRCGPRAHQDDTTAWFLRAERRLRRVITGSCDLTAAYKALDGKTPPPAQAKKKRRR